MMLYGTTFAMPKTFAISAKDFGDLSERLWKTLRKSFANAAKVFRTPMFIPRQGKRTTIKPSLIKLQEIHYPNLHVSF